MMGIEHVKNLALIPGAELVAYADPDERSYSNRPVLFSVRQVSPSFPRRNWYLVTPPSRSR